MAAKKSMRSKLSAKTNEKRNTKSGRAKMPSGDFALPKEKKYRIDDPAHARNALARVAQFGSSSQKAKVRKAVHAKYPSIGKTSSKKSTKGK